MEKNKIKMIILISALSFSLIISVNATVKTPCVVVNGNQLDCDVILQNERVYIPLRAVSQSLGAEVSWDSDNYTASVNLDSSDCGLSSVISDVSSSVVAIVGNYGAEGMDSHVEALSHGSGVIIKSGGEILTNAHVVKNLKQIIVVMSDGMGYEATLKYIDEDFDLAVVKINKIGLKPIKFADMSAVNVGQTVVAIGTPISFTLRNSASKGIISGINCTVNSDYRLIQTDAAINPGNSGGALVNVKGELVGINSSKFVSDAIEGMGFAIPCDTVKYVLSQFDNYGRFRKIKTGIEYEESWAASLGLPTYEGLSIKYVADGSAAGNAEIKAGDIIKKIGVVSIHGNVDYKEAMKQYNVGDTMEFLIERGGTEYLFYLNAVEN